MQMSGSKIAVGLGAAALLSLGFMTWSLQQQVGDLEIERNKAERWGDFVERKLHEAREEAAELSTRAEQAQERADQVQETVQETRRAQREAELEREFVREEAERLRQQSEQAQQLAEASRREAERLRRQREQELNRMQEALARITETTRTPMGMVVNLGEDSFLFDFDKTTLRPENREILSRIAGVLLASHGYRLYVYGHTDDLGPDEYNQQLSEGRAEAVRSYLAEAGIPGEIIEVHGFGETSPKIDSESRAARQRNRRVEIGVIDTIINYQGTVDETTP